MSTAQTEAPKEFGILENECPALEKDMGNAPHFELYLTLPNKLVTQNLKQNELEKKDT